MRSTAQPHLESTAVSRSICLVVGLAGAVFTVATWVSFGTEPSFSLFLFLLVSALGGLLPIRIPGLQPLPLSLPVVGTLAVSVGASEAMAAGFIAGMATAAAPDRSVPLLAAWALAGVLSLAAGMAANGFAGFGPGGPLPGSPDAQSLERMGETIAVLTAAFVLAWLASRPARTQRATSWLGRGAVLGASAGAAVTSLALVLACERLGFPTVAACLGSAGVASALWAWRVARLLLVAEREGRRAATGLSLVESIALAIEAKDRTSERHLRRVRAHAAGVGRRLGMAPAELEDLEYAAILHDIGKLAVPESILAKPSALSSEEFQLMSTHASMGAEILRTARLSSGVAAMVRHHHERYDGSGYPDGLVGMEIPLGARILAAVDTFDALTSERPHRRGVTAREAIDYLEHSAGTLFDPRVVRALVEGHAESEEALRAEERGRSAESAAVERAGDAARLPQTRIPIQAVLDHIASSHMEVYSLYEIGQALGKSLNLEESFTLLASKMQRLLHFSACAVYVYDQTKDLLHARYATGAGADRILQVHIPMGRRLAGWVAVHRRPAAASYPSSPLERGSGHPDLEDLTGAPELSKLRSALAAPLVLDGELLGVLALYDTEDLPYTQEEESLIALVASHVAGAVRAGLSWERTQEHTLTDALTGLPNGRFLAGAFEREVARARHQGDPLALMVMNVDNFNGVNDALGTRAGDRFLIGLARAIRSQLRVRDTCTRYLGDEFVAILPGMDALQAEVVAQRLTEAAWRAHADVRPGRPATPALSVGFAVMPADGEDLQTMMSVATERMRARKAVRQAEVSASPTATIAGRSSGDREADR